MSSALCKQKSWSPDSTREEAWIRRGSRLSGHRDPLGGSPSFTDDDLDELRACIELGFGFDSPEIEINNRLTTTLPALGFYRAVMGRNYDVIVGRRSVDSGESSSCAPSECGSPSPSDSPGPATMFRLGEDPKEVKTRLRQWAQVVACSVQCCSGRSAPLT